MVSGAAMLGAMVTVPAVASAATPTCNKGTDTIAKCFPDANLAKAVAKAFQKTDTNAVLTAAEFDGAWSLTAVSANVANLQGVQNFSNLSYLTVTNGRVSDLSPLAGMTSLKNLWLTGNNITDLSKIAGLSNLTELQISRNPVKSLASLQGMTALKTLNASDTNVADLSPIANATGVTTLAVDRTPVSSFAALSKMTQLKDLSASSTKVTAANVDQLTGLTALTRLSMMSDGITTQDLGHFTKLAGLKELELGLNRIQDISPLAKMSNLTRLGAAGQQTVKLPLAKASTVTIQLPKGVKGENPAPADVSFYPLSGKYDQAAGTVTWTGLKGDGLLYADFSASSIGQFAHFTGSFSQEYSSPNKLTVGDIENGNDSNKPADNPSTDQAKQPAGNQGNNGAQVKKDPAVKKTAKKQGKQLASTGTDIAVILGVAVVLMAAGAGLVLMRRRA